MFFDATNTDTSVLEGYDVLPKGDYKLSVDGLMVKSTKSNTGKFIAATFSVASGTYASRKVFANFNIENESAQAQQIGKAQFATFLKAVGKTTLNSEDELSTLTDKVFMASLTVKDDKTYGPKNEVKKYWSINETQVVPPSMRKATVDDLPF